MAIHGAEGWYRAQVASRCRTVVTSALREHAGDMAIHIAGTQPQEIAMTSTTPDLRAAPLGEPKPIIPPLASFYSHARELSWLVVRLTAGGMLLLHGIVKTMAVADKGMAAWAAGFAAGGLARRGIEPALPLAYAVLAIETIGALLIVLGLFTRLAAAAAAIEFAVITFVAHWGNGFGFSSAGGGWEYPLFWGLILFAIALRGGGPYSLDRKLGWEL